MSSEVPERWTIDHAAHRARQERTGLIRRCQPIDFVKPAAGEGGRRELRAQPQRWPAPGGRPNGSRSVLPLGAVALIRDPRKRNPPTRKLTE